MARSAINMLEPRLPPKLRLSIASTRNSSLRVSSTPSDLQIVVISLDYDLTINDDTRHIYDICEWYREFYAKRSIVMRELVKHDLGGRSVANDEHTGRFILRA